MKENKLIHKLLISLAILSAFSSIHSQFPPNSAETIDAHEIYDFIRENQGYIATLAAGYPVGYIVSQLASRYIPNMGTVIIRGRPIPVRTFIAILLGYLASYTPALIYAHRNQLNPS